MTVGVGVQLTRRGAHGAVARAVTDVGPVSHVPAVCVVEGGQLTAGEQATRVAETAPARAIADVVGQFDVDRLWFVDGRPYTPDEALEALLEETVAALVGSDDGAAGAVTIGFPREWDDETQHRLRAIAARLSLPLPEIAPGLDAHEAAADAALRRPVVETRSGAEPTGSPLRVLRRRPPDRPEEQPDDVSLRPPRRRIPSGLLLLAAVSLLVGALVFAVRVRGTAGGPEADRPAITSPPATTAGPPISSAPPTVAAVVLGLVTDGAAEAPFRAALERLGHEGGVFDHDVLPLVHPAADLDAAMASIGSSAGAVVTDVTDERLTALVSAASAAGMAVCTTAPPAVVLGGDNQVVVGDVDRCVEFLALAALDARDSDPRRINASVRALLEDDGIACGSFAQCRTLLDANQPVDYEPAPGRLTDARATPTPETP